MLWAKLVATGTTASYSHAVAVDGSGNSIVTGNFNGTATFGSATLTSAGNYDIFVAKYDASGNAVWARQAGGLNYDDGYAIVMDGSGNSVITGLFRDVASFGTITLTSAGAEDIFTTKYDASGNVIWAKRAGGTAVDEGHGIDMDLSGNIVITGSFSNTASFDAFNLTSAGAEDIFITQYDASGNARWTNRAGGVSVDEGFAIATDGSNYNLITGWFSNTADFGAITLTSAGNDDIFIAKMANPIFTKNAQVSNEPRQVSTFALSQNYPNPFNPSTMIVYELPVAENVRLVVYNLFGQKIRTLVDGLKETGSYRAMWDGKDEMGQNAAAGVYLYRITTDSFTETRKMLLIK